MKWIITLPTGLKIDGPPCITSEKIEIECESRFNNFEIVDGTLILYCNSKTIAAFAPGTWCTIKPQE